MPCANKIDAAYTLPSPLAVQRRRPFLLTAIAAIVNVFQEALELRRAAHRTRPFDDQ
jgi:hypothetical protein